MFYHLISGNPHREPSTGALVGVEGHVSQWCQHVVLIQAVLQEERFALHKLGIHIRAVVDVSI